MHQNAPNNVNSLTPLQDLHGIITPSALHFERHHKAPNTPIKPCFLINRMLQISISKFLSSLSKEKPTWEVASFGVRARFVLPSLYGRISRRVSEPR